MCLGTQNPFVSDAFSPSGPRIPHLLRHTPISKRLSGKCARLFVFNGQRCTALKVLFVHKSIADTFLSEFCNAVNALPIGMPWQKGVRITPLPEFEKVEKMAAYVDDAVRKGATIANSGGGDSFGTLFRPAIVCPVATTAKLYGEEQFGPVVPVCSYRTNEEFLEFVASCDYGQQVSL